jgi:hypothetical protein
MGTETPPFIGFVIPETAQRLSGIQMRIRMSLDSGFAGPDLGRARDRIIIRKSGKPDLRSRAGMTALYEGANFQHRDARTR